MQEFGELQGETKYELDPQHALLCLVKLLLREEAKAKHTKAFFIYTISSLDYNTRKFKTRIKKPVTQ